MLAFMRKYRAHLALFLCCIIGLSICYDVLDCITLDLLAGEELQGLTDADFLYLPVMILLWKFYMPFSSSSSFGMTWTHTHCISTL